MAESGDLISFDIIETHKENIQPLASGRSAKSLATVFSPLVVKSPPSHTQDLNEAIRAEYEKELMSIDESDDPLDIYDRYVRWTLDAYPSAQATPSSQLLPLLERATKAFLTSNHYKNDPRYLKIWLHYIRFFSDAPRETFVYLSRHGIGDVLALYYEEFAAWLETAGRWKQAEEIFKIGIEKGARPMERLARKFRQFEERASARQEGSDEPNSPVLTAIRPALAAKHDPFSVASPASTDIQGADRSAAPATGSRRQKLQIFSDDGVEERPSSTGSAKGWETIGTLADRKKENIIEAKPWTGEKMAMGARQGAGAPKMPIFKDESFKQTEMHLRINASQDQKAVNPKTGRIERVFVNLEAIYPDGDGSSAEYCLEELRAAKRGWLQRDWSTERSLRKAKVHTSSDPHTSPRPADTTTTLIPLSGAESNEHSPHMGTQMLLLNDENADPAVAPKADNSFSRRLQREAKDNRTRKIKVREIKNETQTIQTNLNSPPRSKLKRKKSAEPTMTMHTKAATDEVYELFNATLEFTEDVEEESGSEADSDEEYISAGESTETGRLSQTTSEIGEGTQVDVTETQSLAGESDGESQSEATVDAMADETGDDTAWSDFTRNNHEPHVEDGTSSPKASTADAELLQDIGKDNLETEESRRGEDEEVITPTSPMAPFPTSQTRYIPMPPEDCDIPTRPYRDPAIVANNRLPFMTPIVEKTESSLGALTNKEDKDYFSVKTPCPKGDQRGPELGSVWSSPFQEKTEDVEEFEREAKITPPDLGSLKLNQPTQALTSIKPVTVTVFTKEKGSKGPVIKDARCNPNDEHVRETILNEMQPPLSSFRGFFDHRTEGCSKKQEIQKYCKSASNAKKNGIDRTASLSSPPVLAFDGTERTYSIRRELGIGAFAPVYLTESLEKQSEADDVALAVMGKGKFGVARRSLEAIKCEEPPSAWEFYIIQTAHRRCGLSRAAESIVNAYEMHLFKDEGYLVEEYRDQGTLLDLVNIAGQEAVANGSSHPGLDEMLAMFFTVELLRTAEGLHTKGIIHGDMKADNVLVRFDKPSATPSNDSDDISTRYQRDGSCGWSSKGISLIDFGRGIDTRAFIPGVQFIADWPTGPTDCAEMRELRPWTFQADYHGIAAIAHTMLFAKYIDAIAEKGGSLGAGAAKTYRLKESLKRWWQVELWNDFFTLMLNSARHVEDEDGARLPVLKGMKAVRERMETWLEENSEKGVGLRSSIRRMEALLAARKKS